MGIDNAHVNSPSVTGREVEPVYFVLWKNKHAIELIWKKEKKGETATDQTDFTVWSISEMTFQLSDQV